MRLLAVRQQFLKLMARAALKCVEARGLKTMKAVIYARYSSDNQ